MRILPAVSGGELHSEIGLRLLIERFDITNDLERWPSTNTRKNVLGWFLPVEGAAKRKIRVFEIRSFLDGWSSAAGIRGRFSTIDKICRSASMAISFTDPNAPPPEEPSVLVTAVDLYADKHNVYARAHVQDNRYRYTSGASVAATWTLPDGSQVSANRTTNSMGYAYFELDKARRGTYTFTVDDVRFEDFRFDTDNSILSASIDFKVG